MSAVLRAVFEDANLAPSFRRALRPVLTIADEPLIRFRIFVMWDDTETVPMVDDFEVNRKEAFAILRKYLRDGSKVERRDDHYYIEPKGTA